MEFTVCVDLPGGETRELRGLESGDPDGRPVVLLHGTPGSRLGPFPSEAMLYRNSIRLITFDRPGFGGSTRWPKRQVKDAAEDVRLIADHLRLDKIAVVGRSGGAPHALACAALLPDLVVRCASLVTIAPYEAEGLTWTEGMVESNCLAYRNATEGGLAAVEESLLEKRSEMAGGQQSDGVQGSLDGGRMLRRMDSEWHSTDRTVAMNPELNRQLRATYQEALQGDPGGWADDVMAFVTDWGFDPASIDTERVDVLLYHGAEDIYSPCAHSRWLSRRIRDSRLWVEPGVSHFDNLLRLPELLVWSASGVPALSAAG